jgi:hypothetical protein
MFASQEVERQRDEAAQKLESVTRQLERLQRDWSLERHTFEVSSHLTSADLRIPRT